MFFEAVDGAVQLIERTEVGRVLIESMSGYAVMSHMSNFDNDFLRLPYESSEHPAFTVADDPRAGTARGVSDRPHDASSTDANGAVGTGQGAWAIVYVNPPECQRIWVQLDGILVHELTHAMRYTAGAYNRESVRPMPRLRRTAGFPNAEERLAQVMLNIYLSQRGFNRLWLGYGGDSVDGRLWERPRYARGSGRRYSERARYELRAVEDFAHRSLFMKHVFERLGRMRHDGYNPFRDWMESRNPAVVVPRTWRRGPR